MFEKLQIKCLPFYKKRVQTEQGGKCFMSMGLVYFFIWGSYYVICWLFGPAFPS